MVSRPPLEATGRIIVSYRSDDPVYRAIETHRAAEAAVEAELVSCEIVAGEADRLSNAEIEALSVLATVVPTTRQGAAELLRYAAELEQEVRRELEDDEGEFRSVSWFVQTNVAEALSQIA
jgi:hypothetical protein